ncbi:MAG: Gfo/Idh/MocA family oxidoreductase [Candidatus Hydrogenedentes bacterium]|nr:Gfo/Idh/MocA family oxidoreductase [Candidatus Hydrogenedentota bacterium]
MKINLIGTGIMGKGVARALQHNPHVELTAAADVSEPALAAFHLEFPKAKGYASYEAMLDEQKPDAVFIATPDWLHFEPVMACLDRGIHVHVEKPLTTDEQEAAAIVRRVKETGLKLQVSYNHRWLPPYHTTFEKIRSGAVGRPLIGYARKNNPISVPTKMLAAWAKDSSPMWFQSSHDIDLMCWWFDDAPIEVTCRGVKEVLRKKFGWDTYDGLQGSVEFSKGGIATFEAAWIYPETHPAMPDSFMSLVCEHGHLQIDRKDEAVEMSDLDRFSWPRSLLNYRVFDRWVGAFPSCINSFIDAILENREPYVTGFDGWRATAVLDALHRSADTGETVKVAAAPE